MRSLTLLAALAILPTALALADTQYDYAQPGTDGWTHFYDPPFEKPTEIPVSNPARKQMFDLLRPHGSKEAKVPIQFEGSLKAFRNWALFTGESQDKSGKPIAFEGNGNSDTVALYLNTAEGWKLVDFSFGHSDVFYEIWIEKYGMPRTLLGFPE